ncbi:MAG: amino acid adenylation domain-containing protein, partial [Pyrinomonadaceae bacterium]
MMTNEPLNLIELLQRRAQQQPLEKAYTFLSDGESEEITLTYEQVDRRARAVAARLQSMNACGERVLLLYPPGLEYISAFWGCLYAGAVAVPAYPPRQNRSLLRLQSVAADAQSTLALTTSLLLSKVDALTSQCAELKKLRWLATETIPDEMAQLWRRPSIGSDDLAFLQYTSGSTSTPKGVMVTHGNLLTNERMIQEVFHQTQQSIIVGWLPLYHDMGLIGNVLQPIYVGGQCILMSPIAFLQNPFRWLSAISRYRATTSGGPNFAYELCVRKIRSEQRELLDLSSWEVAFNGAEPVRAATMTAFAEAFAPCGFRLQAFRPCYGLAEATLLVSSQDQTRNEPLVKTVSVKALQNNSVAEVPEGRDGVLQLVSCGPPPSGQKVYIYHPETLTECLPGEIGEICVSGPNVTKGYWNQPEETARSFQSHLSQVRAESLLRTGDLGVLLDGNLFVTGRLKDLIIIRGRNHYPQDIERTVEQSHPALRLGGGAAFVIELDGEEKLVVAQEVNSRRQLNGDEVIQAIKEAVVDEHELQVHAVLLLKTGSIPKTSSGKIQRHACREGFLSKSLNTVIEWEMTSLPENEGETSATEPDMQSIESIQAWLKAEVAAKLGVRTSDIEINRPISNYALDSLAAIELTHRIEAGLGVILPMASLLRSASIAEIAAQTQLVAATLRATPVALNTRTTGSEHPLSRGQQALWFIYQLAPESAAYNVATVVRIVSDLNVSTLRRAFQQLLDRHPSLRSSFRTDQDGPVQHILDHAEISFQEIDASRLSEAALNTRLIEEVDRRFDLERGPLLRVHLFARAEKDHVILLVVHHIIADFWSLSILTNELGILYEAAVAESSAHLPSHLFQYADYVHEQEQMLSGPEGERLWAYWQEQLKGELPALNLPIFRSRPPMQTFVGSSQAFKLSEEVTRGLKDLSRAHGATLYMTLLAAFQTLLYRYTGQEDILVGSPTSGRNQNGLAGLIGYFINPVVLRANPSGAATFTSFLEQTKQTVLSAFEHQDYPFPLLVERLQPERESSRSPLFQVMFILQKAHLLNEEGLTAFSLGEAGARVKLGALELESMALEQRISQFDLTLVMVEAGDTISASLQYNTDLFQAATIAQMTEHLKTLLHGIVTQPQQCLSELPLLTPAEKSQILFDWNQTAASYPQHICLHQMFEVQAARTPEAIALIFNDQKVSYAELDLRANQLAHHLRALGVGPEVFVGLLLKRRVEMVVALLAVLKAGGAYLPLETTYPSERLLFMLQNTRASILVTEDSLLDLADELVSLHDAEKLTNESALSQVVCLERDRRAIARQPQTAPLPSAVSQNMAYIIYTSGSTGTPKGVVINHSSAVTMVQWAGEYFTQAQLAGVLASTSISFDLSVFELFVPLSWGGTVILAENALHLPALPEALEVTLVNTVPSAMTELVRNGSLAAKVETVNLAGEALSRELVDQLYGVKQVKQVINLYGPSEDTTYSTFALIPRGEERTPAIGRPLANTQVYVLDSAGQPVPAGVTGELYLAGDGLARGYWERPELTAERFVPDHFSGSCGGRLYRTGDLARFRDGGVLEYIGRIDNQIKLRGYRIELGEVEAVLRQHENVREAIVMVSDEDGSEKRLIAFLVSEKEQTVIAGELRAWTRERLPEYMVPQAFVMLNVMPLTANGKVDRRALLACGEPASGSGVEVIEPRTETEAAVAELWREIVRVDQVSVEDNFFEVGGHSLLATRMMSQVRERFGVEVGLRSFFEEATIAGLASRIELAVEATHLSHGPSIKPVSRLTNPPLSFAQQRLWFLHQLEPDNTAYNMPAAARLTGDLNINALERSLNEIIRRHEVMRTTFVIEDDEPVQLVLPAELFHLPLIDLSSLSASEREVEAMRLTKAEAQQPFDLSRGPLIRFTLLRLGPLEHMLLLTVHHIVFDGSSIDVLIGEMSALHQAYSDHDSPLPELPVQYADYAVWQRQWLQGGELEQQLSYWKGKLADAPEALNLPSDRTRPSVRTVLGAYRSFELSPALVSSLRTLGQEERATLFMVLLAAFQVLLSRYTGQTDVMVGAAVSNRNRAEIEGLIGLFVNMLVMRGDLSGDPNFREYLGRVREVALEAYAHQDLPFETLVESLPLGRDLNSTPLFQVMITLQDSPGDDLTLGGVQLQLEETDGGTAKFDITVQLTETDNGITGRWEYSTDIFDANTIERMVTNFQVLLEGIVENAERPISAISILTEAERHQLYEFNSTAAAYPSTSYLHQLFEEQVEKTPDAVALVSEDGNLSYRELNVRANRLAHYLQRLGVAPEVRVALLLERSPAMIVSMLAVLKAGGAYLPLDQAYPTARLSFMMEDTGAAVLISSQALAVTLPRHKAKVVSLDSQMDLIAQESCENPRSSLAPENLSHVIYTSGSTGQPKGVAIEHRCVINFLHWANHTFSAKELAGVFASTSICFDLSVFEIFSPLICGGAVILADDALHLATHSAAGRVTLINTVPSAMAELLRLKVVGEGVRTINLAGEALKNRLVQETYSQTNVSLVRNLYGPTEYTTYTTGEVVKRGSQRQPTIGRPLANTQVYILDKAMGFVPVGVVGELYIGGVGLARCYLNRPEMTADRFVPDALSGEAGARLYRTGDLAKYLESGEIEFLGRTDHQVKIRGYRIELGEIEEALGRHNGVREVVVVVRGEAGEDQRLVAYVVRAAESDEQELTVVELRRSLQERLPEYMVPSIFVFLEQLPLTPNGKVNRRALPAPESFRPELEAVYVAPRTTTEHLLVEIWSEVLQVEQVGAHDNFFELGGHSLMATRMMSAVRKRFGVEVGLRSFFENATVEALASQVELAVKDQTKSTTPAIIRASREHYRVDTSEQGTLLLPEALRTE